MTRTFGRRDMTRRLRSRPVRASPGSDDALDLRVKRGAGGTRASCGKPDAPLPGAASESDDVCTSTRGRRACSPDARGRRIAALGPAHRVRARRRRSLRNWSKFSRLVLDADPATLEPMAWVVVAIRVVLPVGFVAALVQADLFAGGARGRLLEHLLDHASP